MMLRWRRQEIVREFELNARDEISRLVEFAHAQLAICRDLENMNNDILMELVDKIVNKSLTAEQFELIGGVRVIFTMQLNPLTPIVAIYCTAIKHPVAERVKPSFVIFDIRAL